VGWESRERGGPYYTRSRREGGRVVREYVGGGLAGRLASESDRIERERREAEKRQYRQELERLRSLLAPVLKLSEAAEVLTRAELIASGYHRHKGEWRRERTNT
jgi:hypothetical protein